MQLWMVKACELSAAGLKTMAAVLLVAEDFLARKKIYGTYQPRWEGALAGYNVMIDLGIFEGEYLIIKRPKLRWEIYRGHEIETETFNSIDFMKPCLGCDSLYYCLSTLLLALVVVALRMVELFRPQVVLIERDLC